MARTAHKVDEIDLGIKRLELRMRQRRESLEKPLLKTFNKYNFNEISKRIHKSFDRKYRKIVTKNNSDTKLAVKILLIKFIIFSENFSSLNSEDKVIALFFKSLILSGNCFLLFLSLLMYVAISLGFAIVSSDSP